MLTSLPSLRRHGAPALLAATLFGFAAGALARPEPETLEISGFAVEHSVLVPGDPNEVFDAFTGDVTGWWDHHYSEEPAAMVIEARPGGHFYETFDAEGNGVIHATVSHVRRGAELSFRGPLGFGLMGVHFDMVHRFTFEAEEDADGSSATRVHVRVRGAGEVQEGWAEAVEGVWKHFLDERFEPYVREGRHRR